MSVVVRPAKPEDWPAVARLLVELGYLDGDDPAGTALDRSFAGPDPWCPFFF